MNRLMDYLGWSWRPPATAPSHSRASFVQVAQGFLQGLNLHSLLLEPATLFHHPCGKAFYLMSDWDFIWFDLCPLRTAWLCPLRAAGGINKVTLSLLTVLEPVLRYWTDFPALDVEQSTEVTNYFSSVWLKQLLEDSLMSGIAFINLSRSH